MLTDRIESFIKEMLMQEGVQVDLKRNELAAQFGCAPSQINYVLDTRFTVGHGYIIESRRGGGGFIRIVKIVRDDRADFLHMLYEQLGDQVGRKESMAIIRQMHDQGIIDRNGAYLIHAATDLSGADAPEETKRTIRAYALKSCIRLLLRELEEGK